MNEMYIYTIHFIKGPEAFEWSDWTVEKIESIFQDKHDMRTLASE